MAGVELCPAGRWARIGREMGRILAVRANGRKSEIIVSSMPVAHASECAATTELREAIEQPARRRRCVARLTQKGKRVANPVAGAFSTKKFALDCSRNPLLAAVQRVVREVLGKLYELKAIVGNLLWILRQGSGFPSWCCMRVSADAGCCVGCSGESLIKPSQQELHACFRP